MTDRKPIFDAVRAMLGRGFTNAEVEALDAAIEEAMREPAIIEDDWLALAVPLIQQFEGYEKDLGDGRVRAYLDPVGIPTIGWGSTGPDVRPDTVWTREQAEARFRGGVLKFAVGVDKALAGKPATAPQKAALVAWAYNVGLTAAASSTLLKKHRAGDYEGAAKEFARWNKAGGKVLRGLTRRREAEAALYRKATL